MQWLYALYIATVNALIVPSIDNEILPVVNNKPVIGVLAHETAGPYMMYGDSLIYSEYVEFLHTGGARVVPIRINESMEYYETLFKSINGVLFPGGSLSLTTSSYAKAGKIMFDLAMQANKNGDYFPVWGTCLGFQFLSFLVAEKNLLTTTNAANLPLPLDLLTPAYRDSQIYGKAASDVIEILQQENVTDNDHHYGLTPEVFAENQKLADFFKVLSTNRDRDGKIFVSTIEGKQYPVWGVQFHPEQSYNWNPEFNWIHTSNAVKVTQYFASFFVDRARRNSHSFPNQESALSAMIESYSRFYLQSLDPFESIYVFNCTKS
ncbi:gamma-glutamyl hydrolase-like [Liolophura sinensis]|uniref:gamma-glutamyl hydrolase-like n=1 Tax=Liolophura sinensis TaxID=3198878 RepID=UPI003158A00F